MSSTLLSPLLESILLALFRSSCFSYETQTSKCYVFLDRLLPTLANYKAKIALNTAEQIFQLRIISFFTSSVLSIKAKNKLTTTLLQVALQVLCSISIIYSRCNSSPMIQQIDQRRCAYRLDFMNLLLYIAAITLGPLGSKLPTRTSFRRWICSIYLKLAILDKTQLRTSYLIMFIIIISRSPYYLLQSARLKLLSLLLTIYFI